MELPDFIAIKEIPFDMRRWYATCSQHPTWRPGFGYSVWQAEQHVPAHLAADHDGIDRIGMPVQLVKALANIHDVNLRRQVARGARDWAVRAAQDADPDDDRNN